MGVWVCGWVGVWVCDFVGVEVCWCVSIGTVMSSAASSPDLNSAGCSLMITTCCFGVHSLRTTTLRNCAVVSRRARIRDSWTAASLSSRHKDLLGPRVKKKEEKMTST